VRVIDSGHEYMLTNLDVDPKTGSPEHQRLYFVKREGEGYPGNVGHHTGTTSQEVLRALIERGEYVNGQIACAETEAATALMRTALLLLESRAARRHERLTPELERLKGIEIQLVCKKCGHIGCKGDCH